MLLFACRRSLSGAPAPTPPAQDRGPVQRTVQGKVDQKVRCAPSRVLSSISKTSAPPRVKSFIADDDGGFRFGQLSQNTDYEVWAESNGKKSKPSSHQLLRQQELTSTSISRSTG